MIEVRRIGMAVALWATTSCGETPGRPVGFDLALEAVPGDDGDPARFTTATGWAVELDQAVVAIGPVYLYEGGSIGREVEPARPLQAMRDLLDWIEPRAFAHPGDNLFDGGAIKGEALQQVAFDLIRPPSKVGLGLGRGVAGQVRSFSVILWTPSSTTLGPVELLDDHHAVVSGRASKDGVTVEFIGGLDIPDLGVRRQVDGLAVDFVLDDGGLLILGVDPAKWLDQANFDLLTTQSEQDEQGRWLITADTQVSIAWDLALHRPYAWTGRWEADAASLDDYPLIPGVPE